MLKSFSIFKRNGAQFGRKKGCLKKIRIVHYQDLRALNMQKYSLFVSCFEHVNFTIDKKYSKKHYDNPNYCASLMIFQTYKIVDLKSVHSLGWIL
jgi:hypothetical protein